eukprot:3285004-Lingulodinium_polyedra.AAC.1
MPLISGRSAGSCTSPCWCGPFHRGAPRARLLFRGRWNGPRVSRPSQATTSARGSRSRRRAFVQKVREA